MSTSGLLSHKALSRLLRFSLKVIPLIYKGFRKGAVEMPEKMSGIATLISTNSPCSFGTVEMPEKMSGIATNIILIFPSGELLFKCPKK